MGNTYIECKGLTSGLREFRWFCHLTSSNLNPNWLYNSTEVVVLSYDLNQILIWSGLNQVNFYSPLFEMLVVMAMNMKQSNQKI